MLGLLAVKAAAAAAAAAAASRVEGMFDSLPHKRGAGQPRGKGPFRTAEEAQTSWAGTASKKSRAGNQEGAKDPWDRTWDGQESRADKSKRCKEWDTKAQLSQVH